MVFARSPQGTAGLAVLPVKDEDGAIDSSIGWQRDASDPSNIDPKAENRFLKEQAEYLSNELEAIRSRINEIEKEKEK